MRNAQKAGLKSEPRATETATQMASMRPATSCNKTYATSLSQGVGIQSRSGGGSLTLLARHHASGVLPLDVIAVLRGNTHSATSATEPAMTTQEKPSSNNARKRHTQEPSQT